MRWILIALLLVPVNCFGWSVTHFQEAASGGAPDPSSITLWWNAEATTHTAIDYPESATTWIVGSAATLSAVAAKNGTNGVRVIGAWDFYSITVTSNNYAPSTGKYFCWVKIPTGQFLDGEIVMHRYVDNNNLFEIGVTGTSSTDIEFQLTGVSNSTAWSTLSTSSVNGTENTWYFLEVSVGLNSADITVNGVSIASDTAARALIIGSGTMEFGNFSAVNGDIYIDTIGTTSNVDLDVYTNYRDNTESPR